MNFGLAAIMVAVLFVGLRIANDYAPFWVLFTVAIILAMLSFLVH